MKVIWEITRNHTNPTRFIPKTHWVHLRIFFFLARAPRTARPVQLKTMELWKIWVSNAAASRIPPRGSAFLPRCWHRILARIMDSKGFFQYSVCVCVSCSIFLLAPKKPPGPLPFWANQRWSIMSINSGLSCWCSRTCRRKKTTKNRSMCDQHHWPTPYSMSTSLLQNTADVPNLCHSKRVEDHTLMSFS